MQIDWWTLALQTVNFLVLVWLLQRFLFGPVRRLVETRKARSEELMNAAQAKLSEAEATRAHHAALISELEAHKQDQLKAFQGQLDAEREAELAKAQKQADAIVATARDTSTQERRQAMEQARADLVTLARDLASRILSERGQNEVHSADLVAAMKAFDALSKSERARVLDTLASDPAGVTVVTAQPLDKGARDQIVKALAKQLAHKGAVAFRVDPDLLGGVKVVLPQLQLDASWSTYLDQAVARVLEDEDEPGV